MLLELHRDGIAPCRKLALELDGQISPALIPPLTALYAKTDTLYAKLVRREITWGEYAAGNNEARTAHRAEAQQVAANIQAQLNRSRQGRICNAAPRHGGPLLRQSKLRARGPLNAREVLST